MARSARAPTVRHGSVRRPELLQRLACRPDASLMLLVAPPGYGKSTLLAEWAESDQRPFVWITLGTADRDALEINASITQAFADTGVDEDDPHVLVLDDAHAAGPAALREVVTERLALLGEASQVALASRTRPPLPTGRLRAHRALVEMDAHDLAMSPAQAATLLRLAGLEVDFATAQTLSRRTEGWPAGLYLAALALLGEDDIGDALRCFGGDDRLTGEYFRDELLSALEPELRTFVVETSVLDELSGPLCDSVLERSGSGATLATLAGSGLMLVALDRHEERWRWHGLFREALSAELRRSAPERERALRARASVCLALNGDVDGAIAQAVAGGDPARAGELMWANITSYLGTGRHGALERWLRTFTTDQLAGSAPLSLVAACACLTSGRLDEAHHWTLIAREADLQPPARGTASLQTAVAIVAATAARSGPRQMERDARRAYELEPDHSPWRAICCLLRGLGDYLAGDPDSAAPWLEEGVRRAAAGVPGVAALCLSGLAVIAIDRGEPEAAGDLGDRASALTEEPALAAAPAAALVFATTAATRARAGRVDEAKRDLRHATNLLAALGDAVPWYAALARIMLARAALGLADTVRARSLLAEASRLARRTPDVSVFQRYFDEAWAEVDLLAERALSGPSSLTIAELRILRFLPSHRSFREIAERLDVSVNTVKTQAHAIYRKLDAASRSEAVARASEAGLLGS